MKVQNQFLGQLRKLLNLAPQPIDLSFVTGYLAYGLSSNYVSPIKNSMKQVIQSVDEKAITPHNALQLLVVLKFKVLINSLQGSKKIINELQNYLGELICDNNYLNQKYFREQMEEFKEQQSLGAECPICCVQIDMSELCLLGCAHMFHKTCFQQSAKISIADKNIPIKCPSQYCKLQLTNQQIGYYLNKELKQKYEEFMFQNYVDKNMKDTSWCPTPGCQAVFTFDEALDNYRCPTCKKHYCLLCKCEMHNGLTCQEYQKLADLDEPDRKFMMLVKGAKFKQCPNCKFWVEKNEGCDHMTCRCKYEFCYICGGKYQACLCVGGQVGREARDLQIDSEDQGQGSEIYEDYIPVRVDLLRQRHNSEQIKYEAPIVQQKLPHFQDNIYRLKPNQSLRKGDNQFEDDLQLMNFFNLLEKDYAQIKKKINQEKQSKRGKIQQAQKIQNSEIQKRQKKNELKFEEKLEKSQNKQQPQ